MLLIVTLAFARPDIDAIAASTMRGLSDEAIAWAVQEAMPLSPDDIVELLRAGVDPVILGRVGAPPTADLILRAQELGAWVAPIKVAAVDPKEDSEEESESLERSSICTMISVVGFNARPFEAAIDAQRAAGLTHTQIVPFTGGSAMVCSW